MGARAEAAAATHRAILDATIALFGERFADEVTLDAVAERAGVTVRTVIRRFGSREELMAAAVAQVRERVVAQRMEAPVGDVPGAVRTLVEHYETWAERVSLRLLMQEERDPAMKALADEARAIHRRWVSRVFAPVLARTSGAERRRLLAELVAICDVSVWKVLRRDMGLSRAATETALEEMLLAVADRGRPAG